MVDKIRVTALGLATQLWSDGCVASGVYIFQILRRFCHKDLFFSLVSYIYGFREKRTEHISLAFETNFLKQDHYNNNKTDACASHPVDSR